MKDEGTFMKVMRVMHRTFKTSPSPRVDAAARASAQPLVEALEGRQFFAAPLSTEPAIIMGPTLVTRAITGPSVATVDPVNGAMNVRRDAFPSTELNLVAGGINQN